MKEYQCPICGVHIFEHTLKGCFKAINEDLKDLEKTLSSARARGLRETEQGLLKLKEKFEERKKEAQRYKSEL